ncbi:MAG: hypothetical protein A6F71_00505 [Cycloclasticus sp. symbiont of Poecilosclerida sp. M]|nr:MAG: hypothetical protein A6F71_00505 [Cycloclasticus sp. symbiont of Poecilosclerida sp. M]
MYEGLVEAYGPLGLFISSFISSTIAPGGSEAVLAYLLTKEQFVPIYLVLLATVGNTLGALTTYYLGALAASNFPPKSANKKHFDKANLMIQKYGSVALLLSWLPVIGDVLCLAAGWAKLNLFRSTCFIALGKFARYFLLSLLLS